MSTDVVYERLSRVLTKKDHRAILDEALPPQGDNSGHDEHGLLNSPPGGQDVQGTVNVPTREHSVGSVEDACCRHPLGVVGASGSLART